MNISKALTASALALTVIAATSGAAMAAWVVQDTIVKQNHALLGPTVNHVSEGEEVTIVGEHNNWFKIKIPGPDGWVKKATIGFEEPAVFPGWGDGWGNGGAGFCINGDQAQFCISGGN